MWGLLTKVFSAAAGYWALQGTDIFTATYNFWLG